MRPNPSPTGPLGRYLARRRVARGLTIEQAADMASLAPDAVRRIESGARLAKHTPSSVALLADALEVPRIAVSHHLQGHVCLRDEINARRLRGGRYGGPATHMRGALGGSVTRAHGHRANAEPGGTPDLSPLAPDRPAA